MLLVGRTSQPSYRPSIDWSDLGNKDLAPPAQKQSFTSHDGRYSIVLTSEWHRDEARQSPLLPFVLESPHAAVAIGELAMGDLKEPSTNAVVAALRDLQPWLLRATMTQTSDASPFAFEFNGLVEGEPHTAFLSIAKQPNAFFYVLSTEPTPNLSQSSTRRSFHRDLASLVLRNSDAPECPPTNASESVSWKGLGWNMPTFWRELPLDGADKGEKKGLKSVRDDLVYTSDVATLEVLMMSPQPASSDNPFLQSVAKLSGKNPIGTGKIETIKRPKGSVPFIAYRDVQVGVNYDVRTAILREGTNAFALSLRALHSRKDCSWPLIERIAKEATFGTVAKPSKKKVLIDHGGPQPPSDPELEE